MDNEIRPVSEHSHTLLTRLKKTGSVLLASTRGRVRTRIDRPVRAASIATAISLVLVLGACNSGDDTPLDGSPVPESSGEGGTLFAPYLYLDNAHRPTLAEIADETGQKNFVLAFVLAGPERCTPAWNGVLPVDDPRITAEVAQLQERGGDVIVSSGGASGSYLESTCSSAEELAAAYEEALDAVGSNHLDVDVEAEIPVDLVNDALATLQRDRGTTVTYTVKVENAEEGLTASAVDILSNASDHGLNPIVNAMVMNFGYTGDWDSAMVSAIESALRQLGEIWPDEDAGSLRSRLGITMMVGSNDSGMVTTLDDARVLADYARSNSIAYVGFWSVARDNGGCPGQKEITDVCSGVTQEPYEFTAIFKDLAVERNPVSIRSDEK